MRAGQALKIMNEKGAHTCAQTAVIHIKYIYTGYTGRMKMHLKCNNKNDNGIIILYKGTQAEKESKREKEGKGQHSVERILCPCQKVCYIICSSLIFIVRLAAGDST